jgi:hypothetical protein
MVDLAFPDIKKDEKNSYDVFDKTIALPAFVVLTVIIVPVILECVRCGGACVENFDCFSRMGGEYLQQELVENCSSLSFMQMMLLGDSLQNDSSNSGTLPLEVDITFECYRLVFRYAEAFGTAGVEYWLLLLSVQSSIATSLCWYQSIELLIQMTM